MIHPELDGLDDKNHEVIRSSPHGPEEFTQLVATCHQLVFRYAYRMTGRLHDAEDIRQQVFLRAQSGWSSFAGNCNPTTWVIRITINACRDFTRARNSLRHREEAGRIQQAQRPEERSIKTDDDERGEVVGRCVAALPDSEREIIVLRHYHEYTFVEIAELVGTPVSTVKSRSLAAFRRLRELLDQAGVVDGDDSP